MSKISVKIEMGKEQTTQFTVDNINEIEAKLKDLHGLSAFERDYFKNKGTLDKQIASGWYYLENSVNYSDLCAAREIMDAAKVPPKSRTWRYRSYMTQLEKNDG